MSTENTKEKTQNAQDVVSEKAREIWLAGLGIFSTIEEEGSKLFNNFMEKGKELENKGEEFEKRAKEKAEKLPSLEEIGKFVEDKVNVAFGKIGITSQNEVSDLSSKVDKLTDTVEQLVKKMEDAAKSGSKTSK